MTTRNQVPARQSPPPESLRSRSGRGDGSSRLAGRLVTSNHNLWHHLAMVVISEAVNLVWLLGAGVVIIGGVALFNFTDSVFFKMAVGLPLVLSGAGVFIFKVHEVFLVIFMPKRLEAICRFCNESD